MPPPGGLALNYPLGKRLPKTILFHRSKGEVHMVGLKRRTGVSLCLCLLFVFSAYTVTFHSAYGQSIAMSRHPTVSSAMSPDLFPRVIGKGWVPLTRLAVTVKFYGLKATRTLHATQRGAFGIGIQGVHWCKNLSVVVRDTAGHRVTLHGSIPVSSCTPPSSGAKLVLHVLTARQMQAKQITVDTTKLTTSEMMHVGDVLYVYAPGTGQPSVTLIPDANHFRLIEQGTLPECPPTASCPFPPGFFWRLEATQAGDTIVTLSPACRQSKPPCMLPDRALRVTILP